MRRVPGTTADVRGCGTGIRAMQVRDYDNVMTPARKAQGGSSLPRVPSVPIAKGGTPMKKSLKSNSLGLAVLVAAGLSLTGTNSMAQGSNCAPRDVVVKRLAEKYGESRQSIGVGGQGMVMETFASNESGTWTITVTTPNGMTCLMASGQSYEALAEALPEIENDA